MIFGRLIQCQANENEQGKESPVPNSRSPQPYPVDYFSMRQYSVLVGWATRLVGCVARWQEEWENANPVRSFKDDEI